MNNTIERICRELEDEGEMKILFAVENGSRAWGLNSSDSDFDVRFVFVRPLHEYINLRRRKDVITRTFNNDKIDMVGFDIFKFLTLLSKSNPTCIEWLMSDIVYYGEQPTELINWAKNNFNPTSLYWHYNSMGKNNYKKYIQSNNDVNCKRYIYSVRGILNARFIKMFNKLPYMDFEECINVFSLKLREPEAFEILKWLINKKRDSLEYDQMERIQDLDDFIEEFIDKREDLPVRRGKDYVLNRYLQKQLLSD